MSLWQQYRAPGSDSALTATTKRAKVAIAIDFLTLPTVTFNVPCVFSVLSLEKRRILHVNVTAHRYTGWAAQQIVEAVGPDTRAVRLVRDRDAIYSMLFDTRVRNLGIEQLLISAPRRAPRPAIRSS